MSGRGVIEGRDFSARGEPSSSRAHAVEAARIQAQAVVKVVAISLAVIAAAVLLTVIVLHVRTEIRWVFASLFGALAMLPAVDRVESVRIRGHKVLPRWLAILIV
jgi:hypothetical protein